MVLGLRQSLFDRTQEDGAWCNKWVVNVGAALVPAGSCLFMRGDGGGR